MSLDVDDYNDPATRTVYLRPVVAISLLVLLIFGSLALAFHEAVGDWFAGLRPAPAASIRGQWVGELNVPNVRDPSVRPIGKHAVICFTLKQTEHFLHKYGGTGELVIQDQPPQPIEVTDLWPSGGNGAQSFETGIWRVPFNESDPADFISGGFEGTFTPGNLSLTRQITVGYDMNGTLHKGTDNDCNTLLQRMNARAAR